MTMVHIIGAGVSGLAAATKLAEANIPVRLYEATAKAGGRARSSQDPVMGTIDHGLHYVEAHSPELFAYLTRIHAKDELERIAHPLQFTQAPLADYLELLPLIGRQRGSFLALFTAENILRHEWAERFATLALHTPLASVSMAAARRGIWQRLRQAKTHRWAYAPRHSLNASFIQPALTHLDYFGTTLYFNHALKSIDYKDGILRNLAFARQKIALTLEDVVILATSGPAAEKLIPGLTLEGEQHGAITVHFPVAHQEKAYAYHAPIDAPMDLIRYLPGQISLGIRVANHAWHSDPELLVARLWRWLQKHHAYLAHMPQPDHAIWREKLAGHLLTPDYKPQLPELPARLILAGDWLSAQHASSLENAARSGHHAAAKAQALLGPYPIHRQ